MSKNLYENYMVPISRYEMDMMGYRDELLREELRECGQHAEYVEAMIPVQKLKFKGISGKLKSLVSVIISIF